MTSQPEQDGYGILGGGFGLYGWLPAIARFSDLPIRTLHRYQATLCQKPELTRYLDRVVFLADIDELLSATSTIVCAQRPTDQAALVKRCVDNQWQGRFLLEKPLAPNPVEAFQLLDSIHRGGNGLAVGFSLQATQWSNTLMQRIHSQQVDDVRIRWRFHAHHYRHDSQTWKRFHSQGGGVLRFYAIHLLAILAECGQWRVNDVTQPNVEDLDARIQMSLTNNHCKVSLDCDSSFTQQPCFDVTACSGTQTVFDLSAKDPFQDCFDDVPADNNALTPPEDQRIPYLVKLLQTAESSNWKPGPGIRQHLQLWQQVENALGTSSGV